MRAAEYKSDVELTKGTHYLSQRASYGVSIEKILEKINPAIMKLHCNSIAYAQQWHSVCAYLSKRSEHEHKIRVGTNYGTTNIYKINCSTFE